MFPRPYHKSSFLLGGLEAPVTKFGSGVDKLELNGLAGLAGSVREQGLEEGENTHYQKARDIQ